MIYSFEPLFWEAMKNTVETLIGDNVQGVELRLVVGLMTDKENKPMPLEKEWDMYHEVKKYIKEKYNFELIYIYTDIKIGKEHVLKGLKNYQKALCSHPGLFASFDLVSYEDSQYLYDLMNDLLEAQQKNPNVIYSLHAGETVNYKNENVLDSILLQTKRIGHGLSVMRNEVVKNLVKAKDICVEINPLSNYLLGYCRDLNHHPGKQMIADGVSICINPDDYSCWNENGVSMDHFLCFLYLDFDLRDIKWCLLNSIKYSLYQETQKQVLREKFEGEWKKFISKF